MESRGVMQKDLAAILDTVPSYVSSWWSKQSWVPLEAAEMLADHFGDETIIQRAVAERTRVCESCGHQYTASRQFQRSCKPKCRQRARRRNLAGPEKDRYRGEISGLRLTIYEMCRDCEPLGLCHMAKCPIQRRGDSPFPLVVRRTAQS